MAEHRILFVCLGNICRSPLAEGIMRRHLDRMNRLDEFILDSAGTGAWHAGEAPDARAQQVARSRGIDISDLRARRIIDRDYREFDLIIAMDKSNLADLERNVPLRARASLRRLLDFSPDLQVRDVPDPYCGGADGFQSVVALIERGCVGLLSAIDECRD